MNELTDLVIELATAVRKLPPTPEADEVRRQLLRTILVLDARRLIRPGTWNLKPEAES